MKNRDKKILTDAIAGFEIATGMRLIPFVTQERVELELRDNEFSVQFDALIIPVFNKTRLAGLQKELNRLNGTPVVIARFINKELANLLKELNINFIDAAGNAFIKVPPLFIFINGNRPENYNEYDLRRNKTKYKTAALQIIFALLCNPGLENNPYREIAELAGVGLGTVQLYMNRLLKDNFLTRQNNNDFQLINKEKLFQIWVEDYPSQIRAKNLLGRYEINNQIVDFENTVKNFKALFGGETAAAKLTNYLRPFVHTVYIDTKIGEFILKNRLKKNPNGNLYLMRKFWNFNDDNALINLTPDILIYADLLNTGDQRNIETANIIYETKIAQYLK